MGQNAAHSAETSFCDYTLGAAQDERERLMRPHLFANVAKLNFISDRTGSAAVSTVRETVGLAYSLQETLRGGAVWTRARAECERFKSQSTLLAFLDVGEEGFARDAEAAKLSVLEAALPHAEQLVAHTRQNLVAFRTTSSHLDAMSVQLDHLRSEIEKSRKALALPTSPKATLQVGSLREAIAREQAQDALYQRAVADISRSTAWNLTFASGYEHMSNVRAYSPYTWSVNFDTSLGMFSHHRAVDRTIVAHANFLQQDSSGPAQRAAVLLLRLEAELASAKSRLRDNTVMLKELSGRVDELKGVADIRATEYSDDVWFQTVALSAEHDYLQAHIETLRSVVGETTMVKMEKP